MNAVSSVMSSASRRVTGKRSRRSLLKDRLKQKSSAASSAVTVETAVFIDETLYDIMRKTFSGLPPEKISCYALCLSLCLRMIYESLCTSQSG
jgi:hypothetical protein